MTRRQLVLPGLVIFCFVLLATMPIFLTPAPTHAEGMAYPPALPTEVMDVNTISVQGITKTTSSALAAGYKFYNDGQTFLLVENTYAQIITVTVETPGTVMGLPIGDLSVAVPATTGTRLIGPFPTSIFNQPGPTDKDYAYLTYSSNVTGNEASVKVGAFRLPR